MIIERITYWTIACVLFLTKTPALSQDSKQTNRNKHTMIMERKEINSPKVPRYSTLFPQAVVVDKLIFVSGTPGYDLATGKVISDNLEDQARQCYRNLSAILEEAGSDLTRAVKITQFVVTGSDMAVVNKVFKEFFPDMAPARSTPMVSPFPAGILISVECIAVK